MAKRTQDMAPARTATTIGSAPTGDADIEFAVQDGEVHPTIPAYPPFQFAFHPNAWVVLDGKLVPRLRKVPLQPGIQNVTKGGDGRFQTGALRADLQNAGWSLIPYEWGPNGRKYIKTANTRPGGRGAIQTAYLGQWEVPYQGTDDLGTDTAGYAEWLSSLVASSKIPACPAYLAERMREKMESDLVGHEEKILRGHVGSKKAADAIKTQIGAIDTYLGNLTATEAKTSDADIKID